MNYLERMHETELDHLSLEKYLWICEELWAGNLMGAFYRAGRNYGPRLLEGWLEEGEIGIDELRECLPFVWTGVEFPSLALATPSENWLKMFKLAGFVSDNTDVTRPDEPVRVYRGCTPDTVGHMSWTTHIATAQWFCDRLRDQFKYADSAVYTAVVQPRHVLGLIFERAEHEVVVNPVGLKRISAHQNQLTTRSD